MPCSATWRLSVLGPKISASVHLEGVDRGSWEKCERHLAKSATARVRSSCFRRSSFSVLLSIGFNVEAHLLAPCPHHLHQLSSARHMKLTAFTVCTWFLLSIMFLLSGNVGHDAIGAIWVDMSALPALFPRACKSFDRRAAESHPCAKGLNYEVTSYKSFVESYVQLATPWPR